MIDIHLFECQPVYFKANISRWLKSKRMVKRWAFELAKEIRLRLKTVALCFILPLPIGSTGQHFHNIQTWKQNHCRD